MKSHFIARKILKNQSRDQRDREPPSLQAIAIKTIAQNFELYPQLEGLSSPALVDSIYSAIDIESVSIIVLAQSIESEDFWKRACKESFAFSETQMLAQNRHSPSSASFKQKFFEFYFQRLLKDKDTELVFFSSLVEVAGIFLREFAIEALPSQIGDDVFKALSYMPNLERLRITFLSSSKDYSFQGAFQRGIDLEHAHLIQSHARFNHLRSLVLENNDLEGPGLKALLKSLGNSSGLRELRLGHNKLSEEGVRVLCKFFSQNTDLRVEKLDLSDNDIGAEGAFTLAEWLKREECSLVSLELKANFINNQGATRILENLAANDASKLKSLDISANLIRDDFGESLCNFAARNRNLSALFLDGNEIQLSSGYLQALHGSLEESEAIKILSLRFNNIGEEALAMLKKENLV